MILEAAILNASSTTGCRFLSERTSFKCGLQ
jgi:hypothetical protein